MKTIELPQEAIEASRRFIQNIYPNRYKSIAFIINNMTGAELPFLLTHTINKYIKDQAYREIYYYYINQEPFAVIPHFAVYPSYEVNGYHGILIATDLITYDLLKDSPSKYKYFYVYDLMQFSLAPKELITKIASEKPKIICRSAAHAVELRKLGFQPYDKYVMDLDIDKIVEITDNESKSSIKS